MNGGRVVHDMPAADYQAFPALSASGAWILASECPSLYWHTSPFNQIAAQPEKSKLMDVGTALHLAVLEPTTLEERVVVFDADAWRTKQAMAFKVEAYAAGLVPLLIKDARLVLRLSYALRSNEYVADLLDGAKTEVSYFWTADGIPMKARADIISRDGLAIGDLKASKSASPEFFSRRAFDAGHFLRSPFYADGWEAVTGKRAEYFYIIVSRDEPHLVTIARLDERAQAWGRLMIRRAMELFDLCRKRNRWPGYFSEPTTLSLPGWSEYRLADEEQAGRFDQKTITETEFRAAFELYAPTGVSHA